MFKFIITVIASLSLFGCASKSSVKELQAQVSAHTTTDEVFQATQKQKDDNQDAAIAELYSKTDRLLSKHK